MEEFLKPCGWLTATAHFSPSSLGLKAYMPGCKKCKDLKTVFPIKLPSELKQAIIIARQNVADGTISVVEGETDQWSKPFDQFSVSGGWEEFVHYGFVCNSCGQRF